MPEPAGATTRVSGVSGARSSDALSRGLVDEIGDLERAIEIAAEMAGVEAKAATARIRRPLLGRLVDRFAMTLSRSVADEIEARIGDRFRF